MPSIKMQTGHLCRPTMKAPPASIDHSKWTDSDTPSQVGVMLLKENRNPSPFWNSKFLSFVQEYYRECCTIQQKYPDFDNVPEHLRRPREKPCWLKTKFNDLWEPTIRGEDAQEKRLLWPTSRRFIACVALSTTIPRVSVPRSFRRYPEMGRWTRLLPIREKIIHPTISLNVLTLNHWNLTRSPKLDNS